MARIRKPGTALLRTGMVNKGDEMTKAFWKGREITDIDYHNGWCEIIFKMSDFESPITGTGRYRVAMEDIEIRRVS